MPDLSQLLICSRQQKVAKIQSFVCSNRSDIEVFSTGSNRGRCSPKQYF